MTDLLLVDNDRRIVELAAWFLERRGFGVRTALSYRDARVAIREKMPDLMLADLELGEESGREELPRLSSEGILPRTLVVSGFLDAELDAELRRIDQVVDTLAKPYDMNGLEQRILACLELPELPDGTEQTAADPAVGAVHGTLAPQPPIPGAADTPSGLESGGSPVRTEPAEDEDEDGWVEIVPFQRDAGDHA